MAMILGQAVAAQQNPNSRISLDDQSNSFPAVNRGSWPPAFEGHCGRLDKRILARGADSIVGSLERSAIAASMSWSRSRIPVQGSPAAIALGDFNGDGFPDLAALTNGSTVTILIGNGNGDFTAMAEKPFAGINPVAITAGDFNGDGKTDLAVLNAGEVGTDGSVSILLGNGDGTFAPALRTLATGKEPNSIVVADFNGDGIPDLAVANCGAHDEGGSISVLLGKGDGEFTPASASPEVDGLSSGMIVADFNGDGIPDVAFAVTRRDSGLIRVLPGNGDGTFSAPLDISTGTAPSSIAVGDFNGDGNLDMAVAIDQGIAILLGNGDGTFATGATLPELGESVSAGDFNGDGKADLALVSGNALTILLGNGDGTFAATHSYLETGPNRGLPLIADFNNDGIPDLAIANDSTNSVTVLIARLTETARAAARGVRFSGQAAHIPIAGIIGAEADVFRATRPFALDSPAATPVFSVAGGTYYSTQTVTITSTSPGTTIYYTVQGTTPTTSSTVYAGPVRVSVSETLRAIASGGDYSESPVASAAYVIRPRAVTTTSLSITSGGIAARTVAQGTVVTMTATVKSGAAVVTPGLVNFCAATAKSCTDIHLLGSAPLSSKGTAQFKFVPGPGSHSYKAVCTGAASHLTSTSAAAALTVTPAVHGKYPSVTTFAATGTSADYNLTATVTGDGGLDSLAGTVSFLDLTENSSVLAKAAVGAGKNGIRFVNSPNAQVGANPVQIAVGDFNGDGIPDLAVANYQGFNVSILLGTGTGTFIPGPANPTTPGPPLHIAVADFNGDGKLDLAVSSGGGGNSDTNITVFLGNGNGTFGAGKTRALGGPFVVGDFNRDGFPDVAFADQSGDAIDVLAGNGDGTFKAAAIQTPVDSPYYLAVGDFNANGELDLAVLSAKAGNAVTVLLGNGDGTFTPVQKTVPTGRGPTSIALGDFNDDGKLDMAVVNSSDSTVTILLGNGEGMFTAVAPPLAIAGNPDSMQIGDFNGDGIPDLALATLSSKLVAVYLGQGNGTFAAPVNITPTSDPQSLAVADFNGDGLSDLAIVVFTSQINLRMAQFTQTATGSVTKVALKGSGTHQIRASYSGNSNYVASVSVNKPITGAAEAHAP